MNYNRYPMGFPQRHPGWGSQARYFPVGQPGYANAQRPNEHHSAFGGRLAGLIPRCYSAPVMGHGRQPFPGQGVPNAQAPLIGKGAAGRDPMGPVAKQVGRVDEGHGFREKGSKGSSVPGYKKIRSLTPGGMSEAISLVSHVKTRIKRVEKTLRYDKDTKRRAIAELQTLGRVTRCANLNRMFEHWWDDTRSSVSFILEYCDQGSLSSMIDDMLERRRSFSEDFAWHTMIGVSKGLAFMHSGIGDPAHEQPVPGWNAIFHLDLKPCNIFFSSSGQRGRYPRVVIGDFGCSVSANDIGHGKEDPHRQPYGTPNWYPPEGHAKTRYGAETDIWQCGAIISVMCRRANKPHHRYLESGDACGHGFGKSLSKTGSLVQRCCHRDYRRRPTAHAIFKDSISVAGRKGLDPSSWR
ncbi:hypothetical protein LTS16_008520 [Friedmanniomyces endolithicus]|nr:hypothetical protein LTR59_010835 [Friedmanniomyces endolithicus]KAK0879464.1 hypothetical protein LTR87_006703 [Friedmanniomyces endolithicus]KAK1042775.1 hypothetical protein LTS16_008520 [Friedmanniomyces endolithicus]